MNIASVIVDVPAKQTDREFDYKIPEKWVSVIKPGMRVIVPFGPRKVQGFVSQLKEQSEHSRLKSIEEPMDLEPILNPELLELGDWLTVETLCYKISAYQVMIPAALKAKYEKYIKLTSDNGLNALSEEMKALFNGRDRMDWKEVLNSQAASKIQNELLKGNLEVVYQVKNKLNKKRVKYVEAVIPQEGIQEYAAGLPQNASKQKAACDYFISHPGEITLRELIDQTGTTAQSVKTLVQKNVLKEYEKEIYRDPFENRTFSQTNPFVLTDEQEEALRPINQSINTKSDGTFLLYGITGSGKTEIYLQAIDNALKHGKEAIMLVPEISLTPQMVQRFKGRFSNKVAVMHSGLSVGEKYDEWRKIQRKEVKVVVGARSAIFAPFENLGIIIIDEEHETSYKQEENPRYHARDVAIKRSKYHGCPVVLGSATPSLETFARAQKNVYTLLTLKNRLNSSMLPKVDIVDMREELRTGNRSMFSKMLFEKLTERIEKKEQTVLFLNRRGHSSFVMCRDCGNVMNCPHCDISLTYHRYSHQLKCHYCAFEVPMPSHCPECQSDYIRFFGTGTQKVEEELGKILPQARVIRMDVDTTGKKGSHEKLLTAFQEGKADILLGTQMIAKGLDFPNITLVGVLTADTMLHLPDFRASEKTFQLLTQVSGRAGRHKLPGEVVIQTYTPEHYSIELSGQQDFDSFYAQEMQLRKFNKYPPFYFLALVTVSHEDLMKTVSVTEKITKFLSSGLSSDSVVLGPAASPISRVNDRYRYQCLIKYKREPELRGMLKKIVEHYQKETHQDGLQISIDLNPHMLM
ncbi:primosomal protein N' (replication factor Y) [Peribacillus deserti]|uniref:Replication restart protein PriA n=1 Tax=Peribacillus deserti TaxID=673318 RepID=A0ABS2QGU4_9BACI|nr:primosomal protein N' [Peribacillus deserti]MBM7692322.1 primosomal protein N' (replication factor Y) [Peribacillus deserti]